jgi:hypothetical protein
LKSILLFFANEQGKSANNQTSPFVLPRILQIKDSVPARDRVSEKASGDSESHIRYYNTQRTHPGIGKDSPEPREVQADGQIDKVAVANGLHHYYFRPAA